MVAFVKMFQEGTPKRFVASDHPGCGCTSEFFLRPDIQPQHPSFATLRKEGNKTESGVNLYHKGTHRQNFFWETRVQGNQGSGVQKPGTTTTRKPTRMNRLPGWNQ